MYGIENGGIVTFYKVFMDTNIYDGANYSFGNGFFSKLKEYAGAGLLSLRINSVIEGEVETHIKQRVESAIKNFNKATKDSALTSFRYLSEYKHIMEKQDPLKWINTCQEEFHTLLNACSTERLTVNGIDVEKIMSDYFHKNPPFEAKKPDEFKDAIAVSSVLMDIARLEKDETYCVISNDNGFGTAINEKISEKSRENVMLFSSLKEYIDYMEILNNQAKFLKLFLESRYACQELNDTVREAVMSIDVEIDDHEFDLDEKDIVDVNIIKVIPYIVSIYEENGQPCRAKVALDISCIIKVWYSFMDEEQSYYDKEDQMYLWKTIIEKEARNKTEFELVVSFDINDCLPTSDDEMTWQDGLEEKSISFEDYLDMPSKIELFDDELIDERILRESDPVHYYESDMGGNIEREYAYSVCPDCGTPIGHGNDGGNGFCINCAQKH